MKELRNYQQNMMNNIITDIDSGEERIVMAMCPNSGKTLTSIKLMEELLNSGRSKKILVLAHATTVLRSQFYQSLQDESPNFTYKKITPQARGTKAQVLVALPQGLSKLDLSDVDTLIVDEAHEWYLAKESQKIVKNIKPKHTVLLTGTPSKFIYENHKKPNTYKLHVLAMSDIPAEYMANTQVYVCSSKYNIKDDDYNTNEEVQKAYKFKKKDTEGTIDLFLSEMYKLLNMRYITAADNFIKMSFSKLNKTMIACKSQQQAKQVHAYLAKQGVNAVLSTSDTDKDSDNIKASIEDDSIKVLVVVNRGILGFNLPTLANVVDMTGSRNLDVMYQLFSRVTRTDKKIKKKRYFKIAPAEEVEYMQYVTSAMLSLIHRDNISIYNGKNFKTDIPILVKKTQRKSTGKAKSKSKSKSVPKLHKFEGIDVINVFSKIYSNLDKTLQVYSKSNLGEVRRALEIGSRLPQGYFTKEKIFEESKKCDKFQDLRSPIQKAARRLGIVKELFNDNPQWGAYTGSYSSKENLDIILEGIKGCDSSKEFNSRDGEYYRYNERTRRYNLGTEVYMHKKWWSHRYTACEDYALDLIKERGAYGKYETINSLLISTDYDIRNATRWLVKNKDRDKSEQEKYKERIRTLLNMPAVYSAVRRRVKCSNGVIYPSIKEASKKLGIDKSNIHRVLNGKHGQVKGFTFKYIDKGEDNEQ